MKMVQSFSINVIEKEKKPNVIKRNMIPFLCDGQLYFYMNGWMLHMHIDQPLLFIYYKHNDEDSFTWKCKKKTIVVDLILIRNIKPN